MRTGLILAAVVAVGMLLGWQSLCLEREEAAHTLTKQALAEAIKDGQAWKKLHDQALEAVKAQRESTQACLDREVEAFVAKEEREALLRAAQPRQRTEAEKQKVVDDETRKLAADRLNRTF
jgi:hypothetical protein